MWDFVYDDDDEEEDYSPWVTLFEEFQFFYQVMETIACTRGVSTRGKLKILTNS